ncbi:AMP-binding protein, partial [Streptomyces cinereoruber]|uniref:AMP-binding protein n=1 Tax=Streptomyces cinereoruber TaxID=67260 RepID=UPI003EB9DD00
TADVGDGSLVERFEEQAARHPDRTALVDGERSVTYAELNDTANRWARLLRERGLRRGDMAGVLLERGADFAAVVIAVVKAGAGYTLLDPDFPDERLRSAATDAGIRHLLTCPSLAARIDGPWATHTEAPADLPSLGAGDLGLPIGPDDS